MAYRSWILARRRRTLDNNLVEGINNRIKIINRMAYGVCNDESFLLKIRAAFPGIR
jgi:transposase